MCPGCMRTGEDAQLFLRIPHKPSRLEPGGWSFSLYCLFLLALSILVSHRHMAHGLLPLPHGYKKQWGMEEGNGHRASDNRSGLTLLPLCVCVHLTL